MKKVLQTPNVDFQSNSEKISNNFDPHQTEKILNLRVKRANDKNFVEATAEGDYTHQLSIEEIKDIVCSIYSNYKNNYKTTKTKNAQFELVDSLEQLKTTLTKFLMKTRLQNKNQRTEASLTLIIYQAESKHYTSLVVYFDRGLEQGFYADSLKQAISEDLQKVFNEQQVELISLTSQFTQQEPEDNSNSGIWAIENAADINRMIDFHQELAWGMNQLNQPRGKKGLDEKRMEFAEKLFLDSHWRASHPTIQVNFDEQKRLLFQLPLDRNAETGEPSTKRFKAPGYNVKDLLAIFTENFLIGFSKQLASFHIRARNEHVNMQTLKSELITGATGALVGASLSGIVLGNLAGAVPSVAASARAITGKFLIKKQTSQKITKYFDGLEEGTFSELLCKAAVNIFYSFEYQFMHLIDKAGYKVAMEKLADDAVDRVINFLKNHEPDNIIISNELIEKAVLQGPSDKFFKLKPRSLQVQIKGKVFLNEKNEIISTTKLYKKVGIITFDAFNQFHKLYESVTNPPKSGYRRLFDWEKDENGDLKQSLRPEYIEEFFTPPEYDYVLKPEMLATEVRGILDQIKNRFPLQMAKTSTPKKVSKQPIYFDLREPVADFTGRVEILKQLHETLLSGRKIAVVSALSALSIATSAGSGVSTQSAKSGSHLSISGLGGVGKTQLALQYAKLYAQDYDHNVLWINAETKENLFFSFNKLARKLRLETKDRYGQAKNLEEIVEEVYEYFSDEKSLFILDNVEDYREIEAYLPKSMPGSKPTILITSRYSNWNNVATVFSLNVFTEQETLEFFKKSLAIYSSEEDIKLLNQLLQGLPLALKQAITYINLQQSDSPFTVEDYIDCYKEKAHVLLDFNFAAYSNDPYLKTVFTTFLVSLDKIKAHPTQGNDAIDLLYMMAYLDPENIPLELLYILKKIHRMPAKTFYMLELMDDNLKSPYINNLMYLLKSYSLINSGSQSGQYKVHRIIQQVLRISLERDKKKFLEIIGTTQALLKLYGEYKDWNYLHFLLYMSEHREKDEVKSILGYDSIVPFFNFVAEIAERDITYWRYFLDLAYLKYPKKKFLEFLSDALAYSRKEGYCNLVSDILGYLGEQFDQKRLTQIQLQHVMNQLLRSKDEYKLVRFSKSHEKRRRQEYAYQLIGEFKIKKLGRLFPEFYACSRRKRSLCLTEEQLEKKKSMAMRSHIDKVTLVTHYVSSGLMTKNILSAIMRKDWDEVAINFELIASSELLVKVSNDLFLTPGKNFEAEAHLLEEDLGIENKKVWSLLLDKEFSFVGKKLVFGKSLQVASSFVNRGTGIYFAYNLKNQIKAYQAGETEVLPEIISNGVMTGTTVTEISLEGLEYLNYIVSVAGEVNPYLEGFAILVWLDTDIYEAEEQVQAIQKYIHLSSDEKFIEFVRGFLNYPPSGYLQIKLKNTEMVRHAIDFLKNHTDFTGYIIPDFSPEGILYADNGVYLDKERDVTPVETSPDVPQGGNLFCLSGNLTEHYQRSYLCQYAMGIQYTQNRTGNITLINLGAGNDTVLAFADTPNYFFVGNGEKRYQGGHKGNVFTLDGSATVGQLRGGNESDVLLLEGFQPKSDYLLLDQHGYLCGNLLEEFQVVPLLCPATANKLELVDINQIYGRKQQQEVIYSRQAIQFIDGCGGSAPEHPDIFFITQAANPELSLVLRKNTLVLFQPDTLNNATDYRIPAHETGVATIQLDFNKGIQHRFFFDCTLDDILEMSLENNMLKISVWVEAGIDSGTFTLLISDPYFRAGSQNTNVTTFEQNSSYFFQNMEIKLVNANRIFAQEVTKSKQTFEEYIDYFSNMAKYLNRTMTIQLQENVTLAMGRGNYEIFYVDAVYPTHLMGNGGENVYLIIPPSNGSFPLADITLYANPSAELDSIEQTDTLDLREVYKKIKKICPNAEFHLNLFVDEEDLILTLNSNFIKLNQCNKESFGHVLTVCLKSGIDWYQTLDILLEDTIPKSIVTHDGEEWWLEDVPLLFTENKRIISLTDRDLGENSEIALLRNRGLYSFFHNDSDLILTNIHTDPLDACTLVAHDYYRNPGMKQKLLSAKLHFLNEEDFYLKEHQALMDEAENFSNLLEQLKKPASERKHFPLFIPIRKELPKLRLKRQINRVAASDDSFSLFSLSIKMGIGLGIMISGLLAFRVLNKLRNYPIVDIRLQAIVISGLASLKQAEAQEQNPPVTETQVDFFSSISIQPECLTAMTPMGWLAVCESKHSVVFLKNNQNSCSFYFESYYVNARQLHYIKNGIWETNLCEMAHNALAEEIYPLLPPYWQKEFMEEQWNQQRAWSNWKYHVGMTVTSMVGDGLVLHTPVGNIFKQLGLAPDWQSREDRYFLSLCGLALEQPLFHRSLTPSVLSLGLISMELALLHPATHRAYRYLSQQGDVTKAKFALRLVADMLQLGVNQMSHLAHVLEYCFPASHLAKNMSLALRISHYFYFLTGDLSYWHLGLALLFLPQLPQLLDHIGIPASRAVQKVCQQLANVLLSQSLLQNLAKDAERQAQADHELSRADARVTQARQRLSSVATASTSFFVTKRSVDACSANDEHREKSVALPFFK